MINVIWEGTSNICSLDLWRAVSKSRGYEAVLGHLEEKLSGLKTDAAGRLAEVAGHSAEDLRSTVSYLPEAGEARQQQHARRLADLFGDVVALGALAEEADRAARAGDYRKALVGELFGMRLTTPEAPASALIEGYPGVPKLYESLVAWHECPEENYQAHLRALGRS